MAAPYLIRRRAGYYLRVRIPSDLAPVLGTHLTRSLATKDYLAARRLAVRAVAMLGSVWDEARARMALIWDEEEGAWVHLLGYLQEQQQKEFFLRQAAEVEEANPLDTVKTYTSEEVAGILKAVKADERIAANPVLSATEKARLEGITEGLECALSKLGPMISAPSSAPPSADLADDARLPISRHFDAFFKHQGVSAKTEKEYRITYRKLIEALGDKPIGEVSEAELIAFFDGIPATVKPRGGRTESRP